MSSQCGRLMPRLRQAIEATCALRGDGSRNRDALLAEAASLPSSLHAELTEYFEAIAGELGASSLESNGGRGGSKVEARTLETGRLAGNLWNTKTTPRGLEDGQ